MFRDGLWGRDGSGYLCGELDEIARPREEQVFDPTPILDLLVGIQLERFTK
jgi:hypothetical protein